MKRLWILTLVSLFLLTGCRMMEEIIMPTEKTAEVQPGTKEVVAYIFDDLSEAEARAISAQFNNIPGVISAEFVSREQALDDFMGYQEDEAAFAGVDASFLRHRYIITVASDQWPAVCEQLEQISGIEEIAG